MNKDYVKQSLLEKNVEFLEQLSLIAENEKMETIDFCEAVLNAYLGLVVNITDFSKSLLDQKQLSEKENEILSPFSYLNIK